MKYRWIKLNIYSLLLTILAIFWGYCIFTYHNILYFSIPAGFLMIAIVFFTLEVYMRYPSKVQILNKLIKNGEKHFDHRPFYHLFDSPCMRSVAYWALVELKKQDQYWIIKKEASFPHSYQQTYSVFLTYKDGVTKYYRKEHRTGIIQEITE